MNCIYYDNGCMYSGIREMCQECDLNVTIEEAREVCKAYQADIVRQHIMSVIGELN